MKCSELNTKERLAVTDKVCKDYGIEWYEFEKLTKQKLEQFIIDVYCETSEKQDAKTRREILKELRAGWRQGQEYEQARQSAHKERMQRDLDKILESKEVESE